MITEKFSKKYLLGAAVVGLAVFLLPQSSSILSSIYAAQQTSVEVAPFFQLPGGSAIVTGHGFAPDSNVTIYAKNVVAKVETQKAGEATKTVTYPDTIVVGNT